MTTTRDQHLTDAEITAYVDGELGSPERVAIVEHLDVCAQCRAEVGDVVRLLRSAPEPVSAAPPRRRSRIAWQAGIGIALAASIATILLVRSGAQERVRTPAVRSAEPALNGEARAVIKAIAPPEQATIDADAVAFSWHRTAATFYRITITSSDGRPQWTAETTDTTIALPRNVKLGAGSYFWYLDAIGDGISATTGLRRFQVK